jgi:hypothetical protein
MKNRLKTFLIFILFFAACHNPQKTPPEFSNQSPVAQDSLSPPVAVPADQNPGEKPAATDQPDPEKYQVKKGQVGNIKINMPVTDLINLIPSANLQPVAITREGRGYQAYEINYSGKETQPGLLVEEICEPACRVWRIQVKGPEFKTPEGLGIGSTLGEVKKYYPITYLGAGETEIVAVARAQKITFLLNVSKIPPKEVPFLNIKNTPDEVMVMGMLVF